MAGTGEQISAASLIAPVLGPVALGLELFGIAVIVIGVLMASVTYLRDCHRHSAERAYVRYRANLGRGILLGLEILIGADIIATIISPLTWESVGLLGLVVLIRTFLSFSLEAEIDGEWPWQRKARQSRGSLPLRTSHPDHQRP